MNENINIQLIKKLNSMAIIKIFQIPLHRNNNIRSLINQKQLQQQQRQLQQLLSQQKL
jgi:hypothetical protein